MRSKLSVNSERGEGAPVLFGRGNRKKGRENVEAASTGYLCEKHGSEKEGGAWELKGMPAPRCLCVFEGEGKRARGDARGWARASW